MSAALNDNLYLCFRDLLLTRYGLNYPEHKRTDLAYGLQLALAASGHTSLVELYSDAMAGGPAVDAILAQLTIGETYFFRNGAQFDALRDHIVPELIARRTTLRTLRVWSAGCATGEEPYSLAILLSEMLGDAYPWNLSILATDINPVFLTRARDALYGAWSFRETPHTVRDKYWTAEQGRWRLNPEIRRLVHFARLNLAEPCYPTIANGTCALDLIVCRNVTIYFDTATTQKVAERFYSALAPGGWLIVGHAEPQASVYHQFEVHNFPNTVVYRKPVNAPLFVVDPFNDIFGAEPRQTSSTQQPNMRFPLQSAERSAADYPPVLNEPSTKTYVQPQPQEQIRNSQLASEWQTIAARLEERDTTGVEELLVQLLFTNPAHVQARTALAELYANRGEWVRARQQSLLALEQDPIYVPAHYLLAQIHEHQGQLDAALAAYRRSIYLDQHWVLGMLGMGNIWRRLGRLGDAQRCYRNVITQLGALPPMAPIPGAKGTTASELSVLAAQQMQSLLGNEAAFTADESHLQK